MLLANTLGWRDPHVRRYARTAVAGAWRECLGGARALVRRRGLRSRLTGLAGGVRRGATDAAGTIAGVAAAARATAIVRRTTRDAAA